LARGDLGRSLWMSAGAGRGARALKATLLLTGSALLLSTLAAIALGIARPRANSSWTDLPARSPFGASMQCFWLGIVLMVISPLLAGLAPRLGMYAP